MKRAARLALILLLVIGVWLLADTDARWRASNDTSNFARKLCEQQDSFRGLPTRYNLGPNPDPTLVKLVQSIGRIQRSGDDLYLSFDCGSKVGR